MANTRINGRTECQTDGWTLKRRKSNIQSTFWGQTNVELSGRFVGWIVGLPIGDLMLYCIDSFASRVQSYRVLNAAYKHYSLKTNTTDCSYIHVVCTSVRLSICLVVGMGSCLSCPKRQCIAKSLQWSEHSG